MEINLGVIFLKVLNLMLKSLFFPIFGLVVLSLFFTVDSAYARTEVELAKEIMDDLRSELDAKREAKDAAWDKVREAIGTDDFEDAVKEWEEHRKRVKEAETNYDRAVDAWAHAMEMERIASSGIGLPGDYAILVGVLVVIGLCATILMRQK